MTIGITLNDEKNENYKDVLEDLKNRLRAIYNK